MKVSMNGAVQKQYNQWQKDNEIDPPAFQLARRNKQKYGVPVWKQLGHGYGSGIVMLVILAVFAIVFNKLTPLQMVIAQMFGQWGQAVYICAATFYFFKAIKWMVGKADATDPVTKSKQAKQIEAPTIEIDGKEYVRVR